MIGGSGGWRSIAGPADGRNATPRLYIGALRGGNDNDTTLPTSAAVKDYADTKLKSDVTGITGAVAVANIVLISQSNYDALSSYDTNTLYHII